MNGAVSSGHNGFGNACRSMISTYGFVAHPYKYMISTWNETAGIHVLIACAIPFPFSRSVTLQRQNADSGAESVLCAAVCELDYRPDVGRVTKGAYIEHL
jgi:hypothetical protein